MIGCLGALDGSLLFITAPLYNKCHNFCTDGVNFLVICDAGYHFLFVLLATPGNMT
jgi:hypothetical protein